MFRKLSEKVESGEWVSHLRFVDSTVHLKKKTRCYNSPKQEVGLKIHAGKMKVMHIRHTQGWVDDVDLEEVDGYVHLGKEADMHPNLQPEIVRRRVIEWRTLKFH